MIRRIRAVMWKELLELRQTPRLLGLLIVAPIIQLTMLGYAATTDIRHVPIVIVDGDRTATSRALIERFSASRYFDIMREEAHPDAIDDDLAHGRAWLGIVIPRGFEMAVEGSGADADRTVQVLADGTDANSSGVAMAYAAGLVAEFNGVLAAARGGAAVPAIDARLRVLFNPGLESRHFMVPGVLALLLLLVTTNLAAMAIVRERELGTLEQLSVTPLGNVELILGKLLPYGVIGVLDVFLVMGVAVLWFQVPLRGSPFLLIGSSLVYLLCTFGLGLFISTISSTQQQAMMTSIFFFLIPMMYLSGFIFPIENMPEPIQWITYVIPLRYFLVIVRGIFLKGIGLEVLWPQLTALVVWGAVVLALAVWRAKGVRS
jgi:ABC-2 type transport system permease protein